MRLESPAAGAVCRADPKPRLEHAVVAEPRPVQPQADLPFQAGEKVIPAAALVDLGHLAPALAAANVDRRGNGHKAVEVAPLPAATILNVVGGDLGVPAGQVAKNGGVVRDCVHKSSCLSTAPMGRDPRTSSKPACRQAGHKHQIANKVQKEKKVPNGDSSANNKCARTGIEFGLFILFEN